ncbi:MAG: hypothetical protein A07HR60_00275 [uncultured archaeon A07HR60]|nr:MAG: hypothetical protein A07HR60_00275 [uncultured archaeon A07HR60]
MPASKSNLEPLQLKLSYLVVWILPDLCLSMNTDNYRPLVGDQRYRPIMKPGVSPPAISGAESVSSLTLISIIHVPDEFIRYVILSTPLSTATYYKFDDLTTP